MNTQQDAARDVSKFRKEHACLNPLASFVLEQLQQSFSSCCQISVQFIVAVQRGTVTTARLQYDR